MAACMKSSRAGDQGRPPHGIRPVEGRGAAQDARGGGPLEEVAQDLRFALRGIARAPGFTAMVVLTLALGVGVNVAFLGTFRIATGSGRMSRDAAIEEFTRAAPYTAFEHLRDRSRSVASLAARSEEEVVLAAGDGVEAERVSAEFVSPAYFDLFGARAQVGRLFVSAEADVRSSSAVVVLSAPYWRRRFGSDSAIVGRVVHLAGRVPFTVVGVMGAEVVGASRRPPDIWLPLGMRPALPAWYYGEPGAAGWFAGAGGREWLRMAARLRDGQTLASARREVEQLERELASARSAGGRGGDLWDSMRRLGAGGIDGDEWVGVALVVGACIAVLFVACATVSNLTLARASGRRRETAIRASLGATSARLVRQALVEYGVLSALAALAGAALGMVALRALVLSGVLTPLVGAVDPATLVTRGRLGAVMLVTTFLAAVACAAAVGLPPALRAARGRLAEALRAGWMSTRAVSGRRMRSGFVIAQVALTALLLAVSGLLLRGAREVLSADLGYDRHRVVTIRPTLRLAGYDSAAAAAYWRGLEERLTPGGPVEQVSHGFVPVFTRARAQLATPATPASPGHEPRPGFFNVVSAGYFETLGLRIVRGRRFTDDEVRSSTPVAIVSEATAAALWPGVDAIGQILRVEPNDRSSDLVTPSQRAGARVVGVARNAHMTEIGRATELYAYVPGDAGPLLVRTAGDARRLAPVIRSIARATDPALIVGVPTLDELATGADTAAEGGRLAARFAVAVAALSLVLATVGLFGLTAYSVAQRTQEFGIRTALGATRAGVLRLVLSETGRLVAFGAGIGLALAAAGGQVLGSLLFGVSPLDPATYAAVAAVLVGVALVASTAPALAAARVDPARALRAD